MTAAEGDRTAVLAQRIGANLIDAALSAVLSSLLYAPVGGGFPVAVAAELVAIAAIFVVVQGRTGLTPGKLALRIAVIDERGLPPGLLAAFKRTLTLPFETLTLIPLFRAARHPLHQRLGDRWAGTYVVTD